MKKNVRREIANRLPDFVAAYHGDIPLSYRVMAPMLNVLSERVQIDLFGEVRTVVDYTESDKAQSVLKVYRKEICEAIEAHPNQDRVRLIRSFFIDGVIARSSSMRIPNAVQEQLDALRKDNEAQLEIMTEQAGLISELNESLERLRNIVLARLDVGTPELYPVISKKKSKARYHVHGLLARQQQEIKRRFPCLNLTFTMDSVNLSQLDNCKLVFAMTGFMQHNDDETMHNRIRERYVRVSGGLSTLIKIINDMCEDTNG